MNKQWYKDKIRALEKENKYLAEKPKIIDIKYNKMVFYKQPMSQQLHMGLIKETVGRTCTIKEVYPNSTVTLKLNNDEFKMWSQISEYIIEVDGIIAMLKSEIKDLNEAMIQRMIDAEGSEK